MVRADHSSGDLYGEAESPIYLGEPVGFVVELEDGFRFYFAGDTDVFGDMKLIGERFHPSIAFLPIGGHFTMDPGGGGARRRAPRRERRRADALRDVPDPHRARRTSSAPRWRLAASGGVEVHVAEPGGRLA